MDDKTVISNLFNSLRPYAVSVAKDPSVGNLKSFIAKFSGLENGAISKVDLLEYLLYPFKLSFKRSNIMREQQEILCFESLKILIEKSHVDALSESILAWIFNMFSVYIGSHEMLKEKQDARDISEEQKLSLVKLLFTLTSTINSDPLILFYSEEKCMPLIGHVFSVLLDLIVTEKSKDLQSYSINCLWHLSGKRFPEHIQKDTFGSVVSSFFPGICSKVCSLLTSKANIGQKVTADLLNMFSYVVYIVVYDRNNEFNDNLKSLFGTSSDLQNDILNERKTLKVEQSNEWLLSTSKNLCVILRDIISVILANRHPRVQISLLNLISSVTSNCMENLSSIIPDCIDVLVKSSVSDIADVKLKSNEILKRANEVFAKKGLHKLQSSLDERFYTLVLSLPRVMNAVNEDLKLTKLQTLQGYLQFYGDMVKNVLMSSAQMEKILTCLLQVLELETKDISLVEEYTSSSYLTWESSYSSSKSKFFEKRFRRFHDQSIYKAILDILKDLSVHSDISLLIDFLQEKIRQSNMYRNESILLTNYIVFYSNLKGDDLHSAVEMLLDLYVSKEIFYRPITNFTLKGKTLLEEYDTLLFNDNLSHEIINQNILSTCLLIEGIGLFAQLLRNDFNICFIQILYPLLEKVGSTNSNVHNSAMDCLKTIVKHCGYTNIPAIIEQNVDYLLNAITLEFRRLVLHSSAPAVFCVVLQFCERDLLTIVADAAEDVLKNLDEYQEEIASDLLIVLKYFSMAVDKFYGIQMEERQKMENVFIQKPSDLYDDSISVKDYMLSYFETFNNAIGNVDEELDEEITEDEVNQNVEENQDKPKEIPPYFSIVIKSLERCVYFLASDDHDVRCKALEVTLHGVNALHERENDLLPLLHKLWPAVIIQLKSEDEVIIIKTIGVLNVMVKYSGDFMRQRISKEFIGHVLILLKSNQRSLKPSKSMYLRLHKVVVKLIAFLADVIPVLQVDKELFLNVLSVVIPYLDARLHLDVQRVAKETMKKFIVYDYCTTWFALTCIVGNDMIEQINSESFYHLEYVNEPQKYLQKNIISIL